MKKSVIILIALIYIAAIALVSFFGLQFKVFNPVVDVERIEILNEGLKESERLGKYVVIEKNAEGEWKYQIRWRVHPDDATNTRVEFSYDKQNSAVSVDENGIVTFTKNGSITVHIIATDGSNASATLTVIAK